MRALLHTEFTALLARAGVSQAAFARLSGVTPRQVNKWARGHAAVPRWAPLLAIVVEETAPEALLLMLDDTQRSCHEVLGIPGDAEMATSRRAMLGSALPYHPDKGGLPEQMTLVSKAYAGVRPRPEVPPDLAGSRIRVAGSLRDVRFGSGLRPGAAEAGSSAVTCPWPATAAASSSIRTLSLCTSARSCPISPRPRPRLSNWARTASMARPSLCSSGPASGGAVWAAAGRELGC